MVLEIEKVQYLQTLVMVMVCGFGSKTIAKSTKNSHSKYNTIIIISSSESLSVHKHNWWIHKGKTADRNRQQ